jgi:hypothetical protein
MVAPKRFIISVITVNVILIPPCFNFLYFILNSGIPFSRNIKNERPPIKKTALSSSEIFVKNWSKSGIIIYLRVSPHEMICKQKTPF